MNSYQSTNDRSNDAAHGISQTPRSAPCASHDESTSTVAATESSATVERIGAAAPGRLARRVIEKLSELQGGTIHLSLPSGQTVSVGNPAQDQLEVTVQVREVRFFRELAIGGSLGAAEAYLQGLWECDDLVTLIRIFCRNLDRPSTIDGLWSRVAMAGLRVLHWMSRNTRRGSRRNIAAHYDLSNEFFALFLDPTMMYSSAIFPDHECTQDFQLPVDPTALVRELEAASIAKIDRACRVLKLQPGDQLIEIGTGWGGLAEFAAKNYGCHVTTTTISKQQFEYAQRRFAAAGLGDRVTLLFEDYRDLAARGETFDHLVSIEMIEAVGHQFLPIYFKSCSELLRPGGQALIQAITIPDERYESYCQSIDYIQKYIFPGGHLPSVGAMRQSAAQTGTLEFEIAKTFPISYARTLRSWRTRFFQQLPAVRQLGYNDRFIRMWEYYLCYCEGAFLEDAVGVGQFVWRKEG